MASSWLKLDWSSIDGNKTRAESAGRKSRQPAKDIGGACLPCHPYIRVPFIALAIAFAIAFTVAPVSRFKNHDPSYTRRAHGPQLVGVVASRPDSAGDKAASWRCGMRLLRQKIKPLFRAEAFRSSKLNRETTHGKMDCEQIKLHSRP
jgi:hypothetical protein